MTDISEVGGWVMLSCQGNLQIQPQSLHQMFNSIFGIDSVHIVMRILLITIHSTHFLTD